MISRSHPIARRLRDLRRDAAQRAAEGVFVAEGRHLALEALSAGASIELAVVSDRLGTTEEGAGIEARLRDAGVVTHRATDATMDVLQDAKSPQPVVLIVKRTLHSLDAALSASAGPALVAVACGVQDPGNLGALVRTAWAAGATGFVATIGGADPFHPRAVRATMGAIFRIPLAIATIEDLVSQAGTHGLQRIGAVAGEGERYDRLDWSAPSVLLLGAEGAGLPAEAERALDARVTIPMAPGVESLSVTAAAAVLLFEAARARRRLSSGE